MQVHPSGTRIANRYEVAGRPLVGGMGIVYLCFDHQEQRPVALKTFKPEYLPDRVARERFLEEGNTWVRLGKHPHIVQAYSVERIGDGREVYLVLELVAKNEGRRDASLRAWLTPGQALPADQALLIALQIARGMRHATETIPGFVHRDLKPENVLVGADRLSNAPINRVRVTDFGLVRGLRVEQVPATMVADLSQGISRLTRIGSIVGTPHYMAPEQWEGPEVTMQADIYALGCILGEMLTGRMLVQGATLDEVRRAHQGGQGLSEVLSTPDAVRQMLAGCLAVEPGRRYHDWIVVEAGLVSAYGRVAGRPAPEVEAAGALSLAERVTIGWSANEIGLSYLDIGKADSALDYFERVYKTSQTEREPSMEAAGLTNLGLTYAQMGDAQRAIGYFEQALAISREICAAYTRDSPEWVTGRIGEGSALGNLGGAYRHLGDAQRAIGYYEQALAIFRKAGDRFGEGNALGSLGNAYLQLGDAWRAIEHHEQALEISREIGDRRSEGTDLGNVGSDYANLGDARRSIGYYEQALSISIEIGDRRGEGKHLGNLGSAYLHLGNTQRAIGYYEQALTISREIDDRRGEGASQSGLGIAYGQLGHVRQSIVHFEHALAIRREIGDRHGESNVLGDLANAYRQLGDVQQAIAIYEQILTIHRQISDRRGEGASLGNLGSAYGQLGDAQSAIDYFEQALAICREIGDASGVAISSFNMAQLCAQQGDRSRALRMAHEAARLFIQIGHASYARRAQQLVAQLEGQRR